jgi:enoyl-CoA hydratase/carnithine racemase
MTARVFNGEEAKEMGLVTHVDKDPLALAEAFAESIIARSPDAISQTKKLFNNTWLASEKKALDWETRLQRQIIGRYNQRAAASQHSENPMPYQPRKVN